MISLAFGWSCPRSSSTHGFVLSLLSSGTLDGLRIDHIDGLLDPKGYLRRLREKAGPDFYLIVRNPGGA